MEFNLKSGTNVRIDDTKIHISRNTTKGTLKAIAFGRTSGDMFIKLSSISGFILSNDCLFVCGSGLPTPKDFKVSSADDNKQLPNCIIGKEDELKELYDYLINLL